MRGRGEEMRRSVCGEREGWRGEEMRRSVCGEREGWSGRVTVTFLL